jgi:hypothetical protein
MKPDIAPTGPAVPVLDDPAADPALRALIAGARAEAPVADADLARLSKRFGAMVGLELVAVAPLAQAPAAPPGLETIASGGLGQTAVAAKLGGAKLLGGSLAAKLAAASLAVGAVGASWWLGAARPEPTRPPVHEVQVREAEPVPSVTAPAPTRPEVEPLVAPAPSEPVRKRAARIERAAPTERAEAPDELALIREAQALRAQPSQALGVLAQHRKHYPDGVLAQEREVLAVEALLGAGRRKEAAARASAFIKAHPSSVHVARLRTLLGDDLAQ